MKSRANKDFQDESSICVLLVDDQSLLRQGLSVLLSNESDIVVVGEAGNGKEAYLAAEELRPHVILMDLRMPEMNGVEATRLILAKNKEIKIIILTTFDDDSDLVQALMAGASGYLLKDTPIEQIASAIRFVCQGNSLLSGDLLGKLMKSVQPVQTRAPSKYDELLTERELEVFSLIGQGKTNQEIAQALNLTEGTVKNYVTRIFDRIGARDRIHAALLALGAETK
ncbi:MAG: DNA-binding response regulator [Cyanobacteria bacterium DS2.3.42]|nr:DNA-binding response regulator [Cyanobacteria bacterium DS2.3.42]